MKTSEFYLSPNLAIKGSPPDLPNGQFLKSIMPNHLGTQSYFLRPSINFIGRVRILTHCPSAAAFAIALGPPNPPLNSIAEETLDLRGAEFSSALWLLMPTFSLPSAPVALAGQPSLRLKCSPTTPRAQRENNDNNNDHDNFCHCHSQWS